MRLALTATLSLPLLLTGCTLTNTATSGTSAGTLLTGTVHGGQQPVIGAHVYLFAANTTGYGQPSVSLLNSNTDGTDSLGSYVLTDANGGFSITGDYTCTTGAQVYLLATGGNPGLPAPQTNPNLALMTALGQCPASGSFAASIPTVAINEVITIASVYAISGFMTDLTHVSSSGPPLAQTGIANAFATTNNLVDITTGQARTSTPAGNGTVSQTTINTLADIIATCVNSTGASSTPCTTLFSTALNGTTQPSDTVTAALNIAHNPGTGVATLSALVGTTPPFVPVQTYFFNDFMLDVNFTGGGITSSAGMSDSIVVDASGNIWKDNYASNSVSKLNNLGAVVSPATGYTSSGIDLRAALAIDLSGNIWGPNFKLDGPTGTLSSYAGTGNSSPIAIDRSGNIWVGGWSSSLIEINSATGTLVSPIGGFTGGGLGLIEQLAISGAGKVCILNYPAGLSELNSSDGSAVSPSNGYLTGQPSSVGIAVDGSENLWVTSSSGNSVNKISNTGDLLLSANVPFVGGLYQPGSIAIDGIGSVWIVDAFSSFTRLDGSTGASISPYQGYVGDGSGKPGNIALDSSGNVWATSTLTNSITEYIGAAAPVVTPLAAAAATNALGARP